MSKDEFFDPGSEPGAVLAAVLGGLLVDLFNTWQAHLPGVLCLFHLR